MTLEVKEIVIVEGRDDSAAVKRALPVQTIETHGFGIKQETWELVEKAYLQKGIIIFTDPDFSGEQIRRKLTKRFPMAKQAHLARKDAEKNGDVGVENAAPHEIADAIKKARASFEENEEVFTHMDIQGFGLAGSGGAAAKRAEVGKLLGIGYGNAGAFLNKLNKYGVTREELNEAVLACGNNSTQGKAQF
ncbi:MAG: ribonuclease M5 [Clostridiales bacterium]|nr:ribonuclease M5 [Clostridiales bacterium]